MSVQPTRRFAVDGDGQSFSLAEIGELVAMVDGTTVIHIAWTRGAESLVIRRAVANGVTDHASPPAARAAPAPEPLSGPPSAGAAERGPLDTQGVVVASPFVGTFFRSPSPDAPPFTEVGQRVQKGQVLGIIEAMKLMNEIESEVTGTVAEICVPNATTVEFGEKLFRILPG